MLCLKSWADLVGAQVMAGQRVTPAAYIQITTNMRQQQQQQQQQRNVRTPKELDSCSLV
jgi:hypothetical protein